jgi:hypothetical protein
MVFIDNNYAKKGQVLCFSVQIFQKKIADPLFTYGLKFNNNEIFMICLISQKKQFEALIY